ncbi:MAG: helicase-related protein, partial [Desulfobacteraceae bacterium]
HEQDREDHYEDFLRTIHFLFDSDEKTENFQHLLEKFRDVLLNPHATDDPNWLKTKRNIERRLRKVMVRTERLSTHTREVTRGLVTEAGPLSPRDLEGFCMLDTVSRHLGTGDTVEYWKSAPYLLNVMDRDGYKIKEKLVEAVENGENPDLAKVFDGSRSQLLSWDAVSAYQPVDPANARLRGFLRDTLDSGAWKLLWIPPSLPYYQPERGPFADLRLSETTKTLVFSSWAVVPKAIAMMASYEAERRMVQLFEQDARYDRMSRRARLLTFRSTSDRRSGMTVFPLIYPSMTLALGFDPLEQARALSQNGTPPTRQEILSRAEAFLERRISPLTRPFARETGTRPDERWFWVALAALDWKYHRAPAREWLDKENGDHAWWRMVRAGEDPEGNFYEHIQRFLEHFKRPQNLGPPPDDLVPVLAKAAVAAPAVAALRSLARTVGRARTTGEWIPLLAAAARAAMGFRSLFNLPETMLLVRGLRPNDEARYWESVLDYCVDGNLQSVLDEYVHMLREGLGLLDKPQATAATQLSQEIQAAVSLRTVNLDFDEIFPKGAPAEPLQRHSIRCRFALRFGDGRNEEEKIDVRKDLVRCAFNSPFRPFVLATTSIGQEGLDFHPYCHDICHWNLPSNPVDLEQREGRIHRYKGHAIRKNLARVFPLGSLDGERPSQDPWEVMFRMALAQREEGLTDLVPFWSYDIENGYCIRRCVPTFPLSRDREHLDHLQSTLVAYRMVLGQPRQEDLVNFLSRRLAEEVGEGVLDAYRIDVWPI